MPQLTTNQRVGLAVAEELEQRGHEVDLFCIGRVNKERISETFGIALRGRVVCFPWPWSPGLTIYDYPIMAALLGGYSKRYDVTYEAIGPTIHLSSARAPTVAYVFFPPHPDLMGDGKYRSGLWKVYSLPYRAFYALFARNVKNIRLLPNSTYVSDLCELAWGLHSEPLYFPVALKDWEPEDGAPRDGVVTIGRFSAEKNHRDQLQIARAVEDMGATCTFRIAGAESSPMSSGLLSDLRRQAKELGLRDVRFYPNIAREELIAMVRHSSVFLHTMRNEHFGIATVEAIAAGCIPIVHDSGGSREIVPFKELRFQSCREGALKVKMALEGKYDSCLPLLRKHILKFDEREFKTRVADIIISEGEARQSRSKAGRVTAR